MGGFAGLVGVVFSLVVVVVSNGFGCLGIFAYNRACVGVEVDVRLGRLWRSFRVYT